MCGIAGIFAYHNAAPPVDREELRAIRDHMASRGPDGKGEWYSEDGRVGLGHRRLAIIDLSERGAQPMKSQDGRYVIAYNGEIYNYKELRDSLIEKGHVFQSDSDTEVLLHLYAEKGEAMLHNLRGMFAFALWDCVEKRLFLARDPFGIKPLYYADDGRAFRVASQVKALLAGGRVDTTPEPAGHTGFFLWGSVPEPWTLYRGIKALPSGHSLSVTLDGAGRPSPYCSIPQLFADACANPAVGSRNEALEAISSAVRESVTAHQVADVPVGIFLSSGIDSSTIAALGATKGPDSYALTLGFREYVGTGNDEVPLAEAMARRVKAWHRTLMVSREDFEGERERLFACMDQPSIDGVNTWFVAWAAARMNLKVALSGLGGDELFATYPGFRQIPKLVRWIGPFSRIPGLGAAARMAGERVLPTDVSPKYAGLLEYGRSWGSAYLLRRCLFAPWELPKVLDPEIARTGVQSLQSLDHLDRTVRDVVPSGNGSRPPRRCARLAISALEMTWYMRNQLLRDADWAGMGQSVEIRVPFVDVAFLRKSAPWLAAYPDITKSEVAAVTAPQIPPEILGRKKSGFMVPVRDWLIDGRDGRHERGLRGWARFVYGRFADLRG